MLKLLKNRNAPEFVSACKVGSKRCENKGAHIIKKITSFNKPLINVSAHCIENCRCYPMDGLASLILHSLLLLFYH